MILGLQGIWLCSLVAVASAKLTVNNAKVEVLSGLGVTKSKSELHENNKYPEIDVDSTESLRISFEVSQDHRPDQSSILWETKNHSDVYIQPVKVRTTGRAKFELDAKRLPKGLQSLIVESPSVYGTLLLSAPSKEAGEINRAKLPIGLITFPPQQLKTSKFVPPAEWEQEKYEVRDNIFWQQPSPRKKPSALIWFLGTILVLLPLVAWALVCIPYLDLALSFSSKTSLFWSTLVAFEILNLVYWAGLKLTSALPIYLLGLFLILLVGRYTLN